MRFRFHIIAILLISILIASCKEQPVPESQPAPSPIAVVEPTAAAEPAPAEAERPALADSGIFFSELLPGVPGGNNAEFIELYNASEQPVDLGGYTIWYLLSAGQDESLIARLDRGSEIPGLGHFLLVRDGQEFGLTPDATFDISLFEKKGGLVLKDAGGELVDQLGWGAAPAGYFAGSPAAAPESGASLERLPGSDLGSGLNSGDNSADLAAIPTPDPQNSGSVPVPVPAARLELRLDAPEVVEPGVEFDFVLTVSNLSDKPAAAARVALPIPAQFTVLSPAQPAYDQRGMMQIDLEDLAAGDSAEAVVTLRSPYTYIDSLVRGHYVEAPGFLRAYAAPHLLAMAGGSVPIAAARTLVGSLVTVEGVATIQTGALFAGSTGTKFYLEDETGGAQVYVPGGSGVVRVNIGDRIRVTGKVEIYRDSLEIVPGDPRADVSKVGSEAPLAPLFTGIEEYLSDDSLRGRLLTLEGTATRIEEFSYSYEIDLTDDQGSTALIYVDKLTEMSTEPMDVGKRYQITGIDELYSGKLQIYPRVQADIKELFPPELALDVIAPNSAAIGDEMAYEYTVYNHTDAVMTNVLLTAVPPQSGVSILDIADGGTLQDGVIRWVIDELAGESGSQSVSYSLRLEADAGPWITAESASATADQWETPATIGAYLTFVGSGVPIWSIQGDGPVSPYVRNLVSTEGVVTGVFPDLSGFWIQEVDSDDSEATSAGVFVLADMEAQQLAVGDLVQLTGKVREISGQTTLDASAPDAVAVISSGNALPDPIGYNPPADAAESLIYSEAREGMLVTLSEPALVVAATTKYGEFGMVSQSQGIDSVGRTDEAGYLMFGDDGSSMTHLDQSTMPNALQRGDVVTGLTGPLAYTYGNYKIVSLESPQFTRQELVFDNLPAADSTQFSVATFNVENWFDLLDPHPSDPPRPTLSEYRTKGHKIAEVIAAAGAPTIVGLQEVENIGVLEDLVEDELLAGFGYVPYLIEGTDSRGIDVGYIVRSDRATVEEVAAFVAPEGLTSRPPLMVKVTIHLDGGDQTVYALNNHFTSMSAGVEATEPRRNAQALWNLDVISGLQAADPEALFLVMGDLNSFYDSQPIDSLRAGGLRHSYEYLGAGGQLPFSYIYQGRTQTLDHILMSDALFQQIVSVDVLHVSTTFPLPMPEDQSARHTSDHDPVVVLFAQP